MVLKEKEKKKSEQLITRLSKTELEQIESKVQQQQNGKIREIKAEKHQLRWWIQDQESIARKKKKIIPLKSFHKRTYRG